MYPQQVNSLGDEVKKVDPKAGDAQMDATSKEAREAQYKIEDEATAREIKAKFDKKSKDMAAKYAQAYNGGVLHPDFDEKETVVAKEIKKVQDEEKEKKNAEEAIKTAEENRLKSEMAVKQKEADKKLDAKNKKADAERK